jgi:hypothetical protein
MSTPQRSGADEMALLNLARGGDEGAFGELVETHRGMAGSPAPRSSPASACPPNSTENPRLRVGAQACGGAVSPVHPPLCPLGAPRSPEVGQLQRRRELIGVANIGGMLV